MAENALIKLCGLWTQDKNGKKYMAGNLTATTRLMVFKNENKRNEKDPDYNLCIAQKEPRNQPANNQPPSDEFFG